MNLFINLMFYCGFCKQKINELYTLMGNEKALRSDVTIGSQDSLFHPIRPVVKEIEMEDEDKGLCIRIDDVFSTQPEDTPESTVNDVLDLSVCKATDDPDKESVIIKEDEKSAQAKENEELLLDVLDLNSLEEESPLIIFEDPKLLEIDDDDVIEQLAKDCETPVANPLTKPPDKPLSGEKNKENKTSPIKTSQQILEEIYYKHKDKVNSGLIKKKSLKEKLDNMMQSNETTAAKRKVICRAPQSRALKRVISKPHANRGVKQKISEINPILPPPPSNKVKRVKNNIIKTVCVDKNSSKLVNEYVPLVSFNDEQAPAVHKNRTVHLNDKKRNHIKKLAKLLKREKRKQRLLKRAQIELEPPPGVDLDEFLLEQVAQIKQKLKEEESFDKNKLDVPDIIKGQIHADGVITPHESSHRKVVQYSASELEQGEIGDSSDEKYVNKSYKTPDSSSHSYQQIEISDNETGSKSNRCLSSSRTPEDRNKLVRLRSKSPVNYSKTRFRSRSRSPVSKHRRYSPLRDRKSSPSYRRLCSPDKKYKSYDRNRSKTPEKQRYTTDKNYRSRSPRDKRYLPQKTYRSKSPDKRRYSKSPDRRRSPEKSRHHHHHHKSNHELKYRERTPDRSRNHGDNKRSDYYDGYKKSCVRSVDYSRNRSPEQYISSKHRSVEYRHMSPKRKAILPDDSYSRRTEASHSKRHDYTSPRRSPEGHSSRFARSSPPHRSYHRLEHKAKDYYSPVSVGSFSPADNHPSSPHSETEIIETTTTTTTVVQEEIVTIEL